MPRFFLPAFLLLGLLATSACNQQASDSRTAAPQQVLPSRELDPGEAQLARYVKLVNANQGRRSYRYFEKGNNAKEETQWSVIQADTSQGLFFSGEVYNVFQPDSSSSTEYYVLEFAFGGEDQLSRWAVRDLQFVASEEGLRLTQLNEQELRVADQFQYETTAGTFDIYKLEGYAHPEDMEPGHIKFWSPVFGTLLIWYGEDRKLELTKMEGLDSQASYRQLIKRLTAEELHQ
jgi:hypothetical protein